MSRVSSGDSGSDDNSSDAISHLSKKIDALVQQVQQLSQEQQRFENRLNEEVSSAKQAANEAKQIAKDAQSLARRARRSSRTSSAGPEEISAATISPETLEKITKLQEDVAKIQVDMTGFRNDVRDIQANMLGLRNEFTQIQNPNRPESSIDRSNFDKIQGDIASFREILNGIPLDQIHHDVKCLKSEFKQLLTVKPGNDRPQALDNLIVTVRDEVKTAIQKDIKQQFRCIKHELRSLHQTGGGRMHDMNALADSPHDGRVMTVPFTGQVAAEINDLKKEVEALRAQANLGGIPQISQVFVDLPEAAAVQLCFRAKQFSPYEEA